MSSKLMPLQAMVFVREYLQTHFCVDCGEPDPRVLDFDHRGEKNFTIGDVLTRGMDVSKIAAEIELCDVRCSNCHRKKHCLNSYRSESLEELKRELASRGHEPLAAQVNPLRFAKRSKGHLISRSMNAS